MSPEGRFYSVRWSGAGRWWLYSDLSKRKWFHFFLCSSSRGENIQFFMLSNKKEKADLACLSSNHDAVTFFCVLTPMTSKCGECRAADRISMSDFTGWTLISSKSSTSLTALKLNWCRRWTWRWQSVIVGVVWRWRKLLVLLRTARERLRPLWSQFRVLLRLISRFFMFSCSSSWSWSASAAIETGDGLSGRDTAPENFSVWGREKEDKPTLEYNICKQWFNL